MITPSFGLTATERVLPKFALNFTNASLDPRVTFSRALNTATRVNSNGYIETVNADTPRFDYDPITLACKGLLIEESRINSLIYSEQFNVSATWVPSANISVSADAAISPANTLTADKLINANGASGESIAQLSSYTSGTTYTYSVFLKAAGNTTFILLANSNLFSDATFRFATFNLSNGTYTLGGGSGATATITAFKNSWYRCSLTFTPSVTISGAVQLRNNNVGNGIDGVYVWGAQNEIGAFATSYIPTTTTSLTRNADETVIVGANFSGFYQGLNSTFAVQYDARSSPRFGTRLLTLFNSGTLILNLEGVRAEIFDGVGFNGITWASTAAGKVAFGMNATTFAGTANGGTISSGSAVAASTPVSMRIGNAVGESLNGHMQKIFYWPFKLTDAELRAFSK